MKKIIASTVVLGCLMISQTWAETTDKTTATAATTTTDSKKTATSSTPTENNTSVINDLCETYAEEDNISAAEKPAYLAKCLKSMTDLSEAVHEPVPVENATTAEPTVTPTSEKVNSTPEELSKDEIVTTPDPAAEQLSAEKK